MAGGPPSSAKSVFSLSEESLTSGEDLASVDLGSVDFGSEFRGYAMPNMGEEFGLELGSEFGI